MKNPINSSSAHTKNLHILFPSRQALFVPLKLGEIKNLSHIRISIFFLVSYDYALFEVVGREFIIDCVGAFNYARQKSISRDGGVSRPMHVCRQSTDRSTEHSITNQWRVIQGSWSNTTNTHSTLPSKEKIITIAAFSEVKPSSTVNIDRMHHRVGKRSLGRGWGWLAERRV